MIDGKRINNVEITGTIQEVNTQIRSTADGRNYISGKIVVKTTVADKESAIELKVFAFEKTKSGDNNKQYLSYKTLEGMLNKKVRIQGEIREGSMINQATGNLTKFNELYAKFINSASANATEEAKFEFSGFVVKPIYERRDREDNLLGYRLEVIRFDIDKNDLKIAEAVESSYVVGSTVTFQGTISYTTRTQTKVEEVAFGDPVVKNFVVNDKVYRITGGNNPVEEGNPAAYSEAEIKTLVEAYKAADVQKLEAAKNSMEEEEKPSAAASAINNITRRSSLI
jgi:hypothetical protein